MSEPVTLAQAKAHLRVVVADDDDYITSLIVAARQMVEGRTHLALVQRDDAQSYDSFSQYLSPLAAPLQSVVSIEYVAQDGTTATVDEATYRVNKNVNPARVSLASGKNWPSAASEDGAVTVTWRVGYADPDDVPAPLKQWMLLAIGTMYENREQIAAGVQLSSIPDDFMGLLWQPYMVYT